MHCKVLRRYITSHKYNKMFIIVNIIILACNLGVTFYVIMLVFLLHGTFLPHNRYNNQRYVCLSYYSVCCVRHRQNIYTVEMLRTPLGFLLKCIYPWSTITPFQSNTSAVIRIAHLFIFLNCNIFDFLTAKYKYRFLKKP